MTQIQRFAYAACATPPGTAGIAVIRMAGSGAIPIADELFHFISPSISSVREMPPYSCAYGKLTDPVTHETVDHVVLTLFRAPRSYTGEDIVEISCHGGQTVKEDILKLLIRHGARPALPGEFTRMAFLNGKIDLSQAEAVMDLISASSATASRQAVRQLEGQLSKMIRDLSDRVFRLLAEIEMVLEFPESDESSYSPESVTPPLIGLSESLERLINSFSQGRILTEGFTVAIAGKPNAGKSSMLNALIGYERAIVTEVPGTTRDTVEEMADIGGIPVRLIDTAGLRASGDQVEKMGMDRARQAIATADLVFWICVETDPDQGLSPADDEDFMDLIDAKRRDATALIIGKSDLYAYEQHKRQLLLLFPEAIILPFSAVTGEGVQEIQELIRAKYQEYGSGSGEEVILTNARHLHAITRAKDACEMAKQCVENGLTPDILAGSLRSIAGYLSEITGDEVSEQLINNIFSRFCVGK
jgi:tRNA modification GTPase